MKMCINKNRTTLTLERLGISQVPKISHLLLQDFSTYKYKWRKKGYGKRKIGTIYRKDVNFLLEHYSDDFLEIFELPRLSQISTINNTILHYYKAFCENYTMMSNGVFISDLDKDYINAEKALRPTLCLFFMQSYLFLKNYLSFIGAFKQSYKEKANNSSFLPLCLASNYQGRLDGRIIKLPIDKLSAYPSKYYLSSLPLQDEIFQFIENKPISLFDLSGHIERLKALLEIEEYKRFPYSPFIHQEVKELIVLCIKAIDSIKLDNFSIDNM